MSRRALPCVNFGAILVVVAVVVVVAGGARASDSDDAAIAKSLDAQVAAHAQNGDFSGTVLVTRGGRTIYEKCFGLASRELDVPITKDTRFPVASVTKTFTAAAIALLEADHALAITDALDLYLPDFPPAKKIRLFHLLAHQSGLADPDDPSFAMRDVRPEELVASIGAKPLRYEPGKSGGYSNAGYTVLARVVEVVSGEPFGEFLAARIFAKLGMTGSGTLRSGEVVPRLASGYVPGVGTSARRPTTPDPSALFGSGNVYSTAADLDRWLRAIDRHELFDVAKQPYPFGWGKRRWFERDVLVQSGIIEGFASIILTVPTEALHVVVLMNLQTGFTGDEGKSLLGIALGRPASPPMQRAAPVSVPRATLERFAGEYRWGDGNVPMHVALDGETLTLRWADATSTALLTPLAETRFLDRTSFGEITFDAEGLVWTQNGAETKATRAP